ncbi:LysR family transcriptional regulator [Cognatishimia sp. SS12]|uniref:LysR family transcriptional regulator n=1 Tax=Cognatishimia sp. SS12 TaxID=2979465 RepID=UPI00232C7E54|nr:LysR family transcriptional regulator [Cognatishimia sp. SS12]MDC0739517.1 LysR family transcriptional regulator [Cognatishimia sp. SS12]
MEFNWLKDFETLAACRNFSRAAEERHVSQPAFSRRIRALENAVGVQLINRETLPLSLTPAGNVFATQARMMLQMLDETVERCQSIDAAGENVVRFAASQSLYTTYYKNRIAPLLPESGLSIDLNSSSWPAEKFVSTLQQGHCDVILTYYHPSMSYLAPLEMTQFDYLTLYEDDFLPVVKADATGAPLFTLDSNDKQRVPLLAYNSASAFRPVVDDLLHTHLAASKTLMVSQNALANSVKALILEGFGLGWLPLRLCEKELESGQLVRVPGESLATTLKVRVYCRRENTKPPLRVLWRGLQDAAQTDSVKTVG